MSYDRANTRKKPGIRLYMPTHVLDRIPGYMVIAAFTTALILAILLPQIALKLAALGAFYTLIRFVYMSAAYVQGLKHIQKAEQTDWREQYATAQATHPDNYPMQWGDVHHVVIIPNYTEPLAVLRRSLSNIAASPEAKQIIIVLAMEAREAESLQKAEQLQAEYAGYFAHVFYTLHPADIPGEMRCKSANLAWAGRWVQQHIVDELGYDLDKLIVTTMDADTLWHKGYFPALAYHFLIDPQRHQRFWQAPIRYHGNMYQINPLFRFSNLYPTVVELGYLAAGWWPSLPISSYSLSLRLLESSDYWDANVIADEWHMYIKSFFAQNSSLKLVPIYLPFLAMAVSGENFWQTCKNRYQQTLRHSWGAKEISYTLEQMLKHPQTNLQKSLHLLLVVSHDITQVSAMWVFVTITSQLALLLHPSFLSAVLENPFGFTSFIVLQGSFMLMTVLALGLLLWDIRTWPPRSAPGSAKECLLMFLGFPLLPLFGFFFVILPVLHAQYQLFVGKQLVFQVTAKD